MFELATLLSVIGVVATVVFSEPGVRWLKRRGEKRRRARWSADLHVDHGEILEAKHYAFESWFQEIAVNASGDAAHDTRAGIVNIGDRMLTELSFPIYCDASDVSRDTIAPWARRGAIALPAVVETWDEQKSRGRVVVTLLPPLAPEGRMELRWGYTLPRTFTQTDEYYNWDVATPHFEMGGVLSFGPPWRLAYARWGGELAGRLDAPRIVGQTIHWKRTFPAKAQRFTLRIGLARSGEAELSGT